jgi:hypothetical protein
MLYRSWIAPKCTRGGGSISKQIAVKISIILGKKVEKPVSLGWESELKGGAATQVLENRNEVYSNKENENSVVSVCKRTITDQTTAMLVGIIPKSIK